jgi:serine/threonine protein kinase
VYDYGEYQGAPYLVMEFHSGGTLKNHLGKPVPFRTAVRTLLPVARALEYAHRHNMLHRDVKPANILISAEGEPVLSDFGIAKLREVNSGFTMTATGVGIGTPEYMAPEQGMCLHVDSRVDVYALGVILFELVSGRRPYTADTPMAVIFKHANAPIPDPRQYVGGLPEEVVAVLNRMLAKEPENRYATMTEVIAALERLLEGANAVAAAPRLRQETATIIEPLPPVAIFPAAQKKQAPTLFNYLKLFPTRTFYRSKKVLIPGSVMLFVLAFLVFAALFEPNRLGAGMEGKPTFSPSPSVSTAAPQVPLTGGDAVEEPLTPSPSPSLTPLTTASLTPLVTDTVTPSPTITETTTLTPTSVLLAPANTATYTREPEKPTNTKAPSTKAPTDAPTKTPEPIVRPTNTFTPKPIFKVTATNTKESIWRASPTPTSLKKLP